MVDQGRPSEPILRSGCALSLCSILAAEENDPTAIIGRASQLKYATIFDPRPVHLAIGETYGTDIKRIETSHLRSTFEECTAIISTA